MRPSWHSDSSGSNPQLTLLSLFDLPREYEVLWSPGRTEEEKAQSWTHMQRGTDTLVCRCALGKLGGACLRRAPEQTRISNVTPHVRNLQWNMKALEEDLNQRFLALRSPTVRSHCATNPTAQSHVGLTQGSAWSVEEMINNIFLLPFWDCPTVTLSPSTLDPPSNTGSESCSNPFPFLVVNGIASS